MKDKTYIEKYNELFNLIQTGIQNKLTEMNIEEYQLKTEEFKFNKFHHINRVRKDVLKDNFNNTFYYRILDIKSLAQLADTIGNE